MVAVLATYANLHVIYVKPKNCVINLEPFDTSIGSSQSNNLNTIIYIDGCQGVIS